MTARADSPDAAALLQTAAAKNVERLDEALRIATRHSNGVAAWEALCANGFLPPAWLSDEHRWFGLPRQFYRRKRALAEVDPSLVGRVTFGAGLSTRAARAPIDVRWAAALAAMTPALIEAESMARECVRRANAWFTPNPSFDVGPNVLWLSRRCGVGWEFPPSLKRVNTLVMTLRYALTSRAEAPKFPRPLAEAIEREVGDDLKQIADVSRTAPLVLRGGLPNFEAGYLFSLEASSRFVRALARVAGEKPTPIEGSRVISGVVLPARSQIEDPYEPFLVLAKNAIRWTVEAREGVVLTTITPDEVSAR